VSTRLTKLRQAEAAWYICGPQRVEKGVVAVPPSLERAGSHGSTAWSALAFRFLPQIDGLHTYEACRHAFDFGLHGNAVQNAALLPIAKRALIGQSHRTRKQRNPRPFAAGLRMRKPPPRPCNYCPGGVIILDDYMQPHCQGH